MGLFDFFKKKVEYFPLKEITTTEREQVQKIISQYQDFYEKHKNENLCQYGLIPFGGTSPYHDEPYDKAFSCEFPLQEPYAFEMTETPKQNEALQKVAYGNIPIGSEGCGIYWILLLSGNHAGEIWILTDCGISSVGKSLTLEKWYEKMSSNRIFWHSVLSEWGEERNDFFYSHAAIKLIDHEIEKDEIVFGCSNALCFSCLNFMGKFVNSEDKMIVVTDPLYTYIFGAEAPEDDDDSWECCEWNNGVSFCRCPTPLENK